MRWGSGWPDDLRRSRCTDGQRARMRPGGATGGPVGPPDSGDFGPGPSPPPDRGGSREPKSRPPTLHLGLVPLVTPIIAAEDHVIGVRIMPAGRLVHRPGDEQAFDQKGGHPRGVLLEPEGDGSWGETRRLGRHGISEERSRRWTRVLTRAREGVVQFSDCHQISVPSGLSYRFVEERVPYVAARLQAHGSIRTARSPSSQSYPNGPVFSPDPFTCPRRSTCSPQEDQERARPDPHSDR